MLFYSLIIVVILLNVVDLIQTKSSLEKYSHESEANPVARKIYIKLDFIGLLAFKSIMIGMAIIMAIIARSTLALTILIVLYFAVVIYNNKIAKINKKIISESQEL